jgi:thioredoxin 1
VAAVVEITDTTFGDAVFKSATPVLVEFWAPWARACAAAEPLLLAAARHLPAGVRLARCNIEENPVAATVFGIRRLPTVVLFRGGDELDQWCGPLPPEEVVQRVRNACSGPAAPNGAAGGAESG